MKTPPVIIYSKHCTRVLLVALLLLAPTTCFAQGEAEPPTLSLSEAALRGPAVASVLDLPRETPAQELSAIFTLLDLAEFDVAQRLWQDFAPEMQEQTKAALVKEFGVARFLNLARRQAVTGLDGSRAFAESCLQAAAELGRDPQQLAKLINDLSSDSVETRRAARSDLAVTGDAGAKACIDALAAAPTGEKAEQLRTELLLTLAKMRPTVESLLIAALADGEGQFRRDAVELTGYLQLQDAVSFLAAIAAGADSDPEVVAAAMAALTKMGLSSPGTAEARAVILSEIQRLESHQDPPELDYWWTYDPKEKQISSREVSAKENQLLSIARLAGILGDLPGANLGDQRLGLIYAYQVSELLNQPLSAESKKLADSLDIAQLSETLHEALQNDHQSAAIACAQLLGNRADKSALNSTAGLPSPLATALVHPNRSVRFAALEAVMKTDPQQSFAGASGVAKALWNFASSSGNLQVIVASSIVGSASEWAGELRGRGYDAAPVTTGRQTLLAALNSPRLELILIDSDIGRPLLREVIFGLRSNPQLVQTPIAVLCSLDNLSRAERIAQSDPWLLATPRPHTPEALDTVLSELAELGSDPQSIDRRTEQANAALGWIAQLLENGHPYDELLRESERISKTLYDSKLTAASLKVLAVLGTAGSQQLLVDVSSSPTQTIETRRAAGEAFASSVQRFGKLLTSEEIRRQFDRYNASETADEETQKVLSEILDVLEKQK